MKVGILGAGQLGRMLALAGLPLGLEFRFLDPVAGACAGAVGDLVVGDFADGAALARFRRDLDVVTYEFESVPAAPVRDLAREVPVYPPPEALETAQDRLAEKTLFRRLGIPTPEFAPVGSEADLRDAVDRIGLPAVLKTRRLGYDGKGQRVLRRPEDVPGSYDALGQVPSLLEAFVPFEREVSLLLVRDRQGHGQAYPLVENQHRGGILRLSKAPAADAEGALQAEAEGHVRAIAEALGYVGVLAVEFFVRQGRLLANEMAPRVHNSGHWTIEGARTSQFENHLRAVAGLPLGPTDLRGPAAMVNLIGTVPSPAKVLAVPGAHLHLYGKAPAPGRKLGHVTFLPEEHPGTEAGLLDLLRLVGEDKAISS